MVGQLVGGRYQVLEQVAVGDGHVSYRAVDRENGETVVVHVVSDALAADPRFVARFHRQAHDAAELAHPNIARLHDYGRSGNSYFLAEEWVEGTTLDRYLAVRGPLPSPDAVAIAVAVAGALAAAHAVGLVHGGISPDNVVVRADGVVKVRGFGLARPAGLPPREETAAARGAAYFTSPEQAQGEVPTPASDSYALGALLYTMLGARPPFEGATPLAVALKHVNEDPPPVRSLRPDVPPDLGALVMRSLAKPPAQRYRSGAEMERALRNVSAYRPDVLPMPLGAARPTSVWQRLSTPPVSWLAGLALLLLVTTAGAALLLLAGIAGRQQPGPTATATAVMVAAPGLVGRPVEEAERLAVERGLRLNVVEQRPDPNIPQGAVLEQSPLADRPVAPGSTIDVVVSQGPPQAEVPNLLGRDIEQARAALEQAQLRQGSISERASAPESRGQVLGQNPPPGTRLPRGSAVDLTVGGGPAPTATAPPPTPTEEASPTATVPAVVPPTETPTPAPSPTPLTPTPTATPSPASPTPSPLPATPTMAPATVTATPAAPTATLPPATPTVPPPTATAPPPTATAPLPGSPTAAPSPEVAPSPATTPGE